MSYSRSTKELAYALDPECWLSYAGKPVEYKRRMEVRRSDALRRADKDIKGQKPDLETRLEKLENEVKSLRERVANSGDA